MANGNTIYWEGDRCEICGSRADIMVHHKKPRAAGGEDINENLQILCASCHSDQPGPGHKMVRSWITGIVSFHPFCGGDGGGEYRECSAERRIDCGRCHRQIATGEFAYSRFEAIQCCASCNPLI